MFETREDALLTMRGCSGKIYAASGTVQAS
jgi:hypothetical protein